MCKLRRMKKKRLSPKIKERRAIKKWLSAFPAFENNGIPKVPLHVGIHKEIFKKNAREENTFSRKQVRTVLFQICNEEGYLKLILKSFYRYDLRGKNRKRITSEAYRVTKSKLAWLTGQRRCHDKSVPTAKSLKGQ